MGDAMPKRTAVVYLARIAEGMDVFARFADSYLKYSPDYDHDLIVLVKGLRNRGELVYIEQIFRTIKHQLVSISDEGYDINAYLSVAKQLTHDYILFCNTHTEILSEGWLNKMMAAAGLENVGVVGATASYESISITQKFVSKAIWLANTGKLPFDDEFYQSFRRYLDLHAPKWVRSRKFTKRLLRGDLFREAFSPFTALEAFDDEYDTFWAETTTKNEEPKEFRKFPYFPNPHIRSNCFLIDRNLLLSLDLRLRPTKLDCHLFECGPDGLSAKLLRLGLRLLVVGKNGAAYDVPDWPKSGTIRLNDQSNLLFGDNQTREFSLLRPLEQSTQQTMTWGDYIDSSFPKRLKLGLSFDKSERLLLASRPPRDTASATSAEVGGTLISIVIPTHNRLALVADAIDTVRADSQYNWELIVFDNCSEEPLEAHVKALGDNRIRFFRSDVFLPVTDSWNRAFSEARGGYVMLIGDDDGLTPDFFKEVNELIEDFDKPDCIYCSFYQFLHPGVAPWQREGYVSDLRNAFFFSGRELPFLLRAEERTRAVNGSLQLRRNFTFNMQSLLFSRKLISRLTKNGAFFHTPFPDYYIANVAFALAETIVAQPRPLTIAGVSTRSFGYTLFNNLEEVGAKLLKTDLAEHESFNRCKPYLLPGPAYLTNYIVTMQQVHDTIPADQFSSIDFRRYRRRQIAHFIPTTSKKLSWLKDEPAQLMWRHMTITEKLWALGLSFARKKKRKKLNFYYRNVSAVNEGGFSPFPSQVMLNIGDYTTTLELYEALKAGKL
jgi:glycosyltransferase involved in cell wall biosynthesis